MAQVADSSIQALQKQVSSLLEMIKNLQAQIDALRSQQTSLPLPIPDRGWDTLSGVLSVASPSTNQWGTHMIQVKYSLDSSKVNAIGLESVGYLVKAVDDNVLAILKKYEGQEVTLWGQFQYQNIEGGFTGFIAKKVYAEGYGCILPAKAKIGASGDDVKIVQQYLAMDKKVYPEGLVTGYFGQLTKKAVTRFQEKNGLTATGEIDDSTRTKIEGEVAPTLIGSGSSEEIYPCPKPKPVPIPNQGIKVYSPSAGENWQLGQTYKIAWSQVWPTVTNEKYGCFSQGEGKPQICIDPPPLGTTTFSAIGPVKITLHKYIACLYVGPVRCMMAEPMPYVITEKTDNNGYFTWTIPADLSSQYQGQMIITVDAISGGFSGNSGVFVIGPNVTSENKPPVVTGISGPTTLKAGEMGTWTVKAYDPENGSLSYSVVWGDELSTSLGGLTAPRMMMTQNTATFSRSYSALGNYTPVFYVTDDNGQKVKTSISVSVVAGNVTQTDRETKILVLSPNGGEVWSIGSEQIIRWRASSDIKTVSITINMYHPECYSNGQYVCQTVVPIAPMTIVTNAPNTGEYKWLVGSPLVYGDSIVPAKQYKISVAGQPISKNVVSDSSGAPFSIVAPLM